MVAQAQVDTPLRFRIIRNGEEIQWTVCTVLADASDVAGLLLTILAPLLLGYIWLVIATFSTRTEGILPYMTVFGNISYPLKLKNVPKKEQVERVRWVADMMGIGDLLDCRLGQLSGGQQQRVALGLALVKEPDILLFDEPLPNLDARLRLTMRGGIKYLQKELGITSIYVIHDQVEAMTMADRIAVMNGGHVQAFDPPEEVYDRPKTLFMVGFVGNSPKIGSM